MSNTGALVYTRAATAEKNANSGAFARLCAPSSPLPSPDACPNGPRNEVRRTVTVASMTTSVEMVMRGLTGCARYLVPGVLVIFVMSLGKPCVASRNRGTRWGDVQDLPGVVFAPGGFLELIAPINDRIALNLYGFYHFASTDLGEVKVPIAMVDVPIRTTKFLTITPSYLYYEVPPPSELNEASELLGGVPETFKEAPISN